MELQIFVSKRAGFCPGVKRAVERLLEQAELSGGGATLGPLVHNEQVVDYLRQHSIIAINEPDEAEGAFLAVRTHGISPEKLEKLEKLKHLSIIDLTCPLVKKVQNIAGELSKININIIIFGDPDHPEVEGLAGWAQGRAVVVSDPEKLPDLNIEPPVALIAQTTAGAEKYEQAAALFKEKYPEGKIYSTICPEIKLRKEEAVKLAERVEALVVVGSDSSANTKALFNWCRQLKPTCRINNAGELDRSFIKKYKVIGITAGASTPPWTIKEVVERMENENQETKNEEQFEFEGEVKVATVGEQVTGKVARVTEEEVFVDIGSKTEAVLPAEEVYLEEGKTLGELFAPEDDIEVTVLDTEEQEGRVVVSHKRLARDKRLKELEQALADELVMEGRVKQVVPAGVVVDLGSGVEGFMPGSPVDIRYIPDFKELQDQQIRFKVIEFDREKGKLILSRKKVLEEEEAVKKEETLNSIEVGSTITGTVKRLTDFGAFVDVGGIDGLVHISELAWERIGHPSEVLKTGEEVEVKVLEVIPEKERISLSIRKTQPDPWTKAVKDLESGQFVTGKVTRLVNFGAFIEIRPGVEGLVHISQLADYHVNHPSEILQEGEEVEVKVIEVKPKAKRISLSLKEARGVMATKENKTGADAENGNVTLGDVFGNLFDQEELASRETGADDSEATTEENEIVDEVIKGEDDSGPENEGETAAVEDNSTAEEESDDNDQDTVEEQNDETAEDDNPIKKDDPEQEGDQD